LSTVRATVGDILGHAAARYGVATALTLPDDSAFSFQTLDSLAGRFAAGLIRQGVSRGDRVVLHLANGWEWIVAYHAIARLGAVVAPANILLSGAEVSYIVAHAEARAIILPADRASVATQSRQDAPSSLTTVITVAADSVAPPEAIDFSALLDGQPWFGPSPDPESLFTIGYTSGTTGKPKGAMLTQRAIFESAAMTATTHVRNPSDVVVSGLPFAHVYGNIVLNAGLLAGARLVALGRFDAAEAIGVIEREQATLFEGVPTMYYQMLASLALDKARLSSLRRCTVGGQTMPRAIMDRVTARFGCPLLELWGMTEVAGPAVTHSPYWPSRMGSIGLPFAGTQVRIADLETRTAAAAGQAGELQVRGPLVTQGYWREPEATARALDPEGWLSTGDIARMDADGYLFIVDRLKDMIITAGYNIYPTELEQVVAMHPSVSMVAVAGVPDPEKGELAKAFVVLRPEASLTEAELLAHCRQHLASYKIPRLVAFVADLPKTSTGKIIRHALRVSPPELEGQPS
jgi:long-chain acyl-CoA synthetase